MASPKYKPDPDTPELLPCPFCGGCDLGLELSDENDVNCMVFVRCATCCAEGPIRPVREQYGARKHWNIRPTTGGAR